MLNVFEAIGQRAAARRPETLEQRVARLERDLNAFHGSFERFLIELDRDIGGLSATDATARMALQRVTRLWNELLRLRVVEIGY